MDLYNIDILCIQETSVIDKNSKYICSSNKYDSYFTNEENSFGSEVGIIINKKISKFIHQVRKYKGQIIILELILKNHVTFKIINLYIPTPNTLRTKENILDLYKFLKKEVYEIYNSQSYCIITGDFNLGYNKYKEKKKKSIVDWRFNILSFFEEKDFLDLIEVFYSQESEKNKTLDTFTATDKNKSSSRIDYIFTSTNLVQEVFAINNYNMDLFNTDHKAVIASFFTEEIFNLKTEAKLKQKNLMKEVFYYDKMTDDSWLAYTNTVQQTINNSPQLLDNEPNLNTKWSIIQKAIFNSAKEKIPNRQITTQKNRIHFSKEIKEGILHLRKINKILKNFCKYKNSTNKEGLNK